jgi:hypothetical protein
MKLIYYFIEVLAKLLLSSPFFRRGIEGVASLKLNSLIIIKLFKPPQSPFKKGGGKSCKFYNFASTS